MRRLAALLLAATCGLAAQDREIIAQFRLDMSRQGTDDHVAGSGVGSTLGLVLTERRAAGLCFQLDGRISADRFENERFHQELNGVGVGFGAKLYFSGRPEGFYLTSALLAQHWGYSARSTQGLSTFNTTRAGETAALGWRMKALELEVGIQETVVDADLRWSHAFVGFGFQF